MLKSRKNSVLLAFIAIAAIFVEVDAKPPSRIRGGQDAGAGEFPYVVSISRRGIRHYCGGAIISSRHILTAGHCISGTGKITVNSGIENLDDSNLIVRNVDRVVLHSNYSAQTKFRSVRNDIGILVLDEDLILGDRVNKILLPKEEPEANNENNKVVAGWGAVSKNQKDYQLTLQKTAIRLLNDEECEVKRLFVVRPEMLCGYQDNTSLCVGDSGSPLVSDKEIIGVASTSSCTIGTANSYTSVYNYLNWINSVIDSSS